jgi:hypothetical protein
MLSVRADIQGDKVVIQGLSYFAGRFPAAVERGLSRVGKGVFRVAHGYLSGPGAKASSVSPGGYPVPVRTGHLRRLLGWLKPGQSKTAEGLTFTAGKMEIVVFNSAEYARPVHEGKGSSSDYGQRAFLVDGFRRFNGSGRSAEILEEEVGKEIGRAGF